MKRNDGPAYSTTVVALCTNTSHALLDYYSREGLVTASIDRGQGRGQRRRYSFADIVAIVVVRVANHCGVEFKYLKPALDLIQNTPDIESIESNRLLLIPMQGGDAVTSMQPMEPAEMFARGLVLSVPLGGLVRVLKQRIDDAQRGITPDSAPFLAAA